MLPCVRRFNQTKLVLAVCMLLAGIAEVVVAQEPRATVIVTVKAANALVEGAAVTVNGVAVRGNQQGVASVGLTIGKATIHVKKDGFLPSTTSLSVDELREWQVEVE